MLKTVRQNKRNTAGEIVSLNLVRRVNTSLLHPPHQYYTGDGSLETFTPLFYYFPWWHNFHPWFTSETIADTLV